MKARQYKGARRSYESRAVALRDIVDRGNGDVRYEPCGHPASPLRVGGRETLSVVEQADAGTSYLEDPKLSPLQHEQVGRSARIAMQEHYHLPVIVRARWELPMGAYKHSGGPI